MDNTALNLQRSIVPESIKELRINLQFNGIYKDVKSILVTSPLAKEGKSFIAKSLAIAFAQNKKKVIVVDGDTRTGVQAEIFDAQLTDGLSDLLSKMESTPDFDLGCLDDYIKSTDFENISILTRGTRCTNPAELFSSDSMLLLYEKLKETFDIIIFDGSSSLLFTDGIILSTIADITVIVAKYKITKIEDLKKLKKYIEGVGGRIAGVVLNSFGYKEINFKASLSRKKRKEKKKDIYPGYYVNNQS